MAGPWEPAAMTRRGQRAVSQCRVWVHRLAAAAIEAFPEPPFDRPRQPAAFLAAHDVLLATFAESVRASDDPPRVTRWYLPATSMGDRTWPVAPLHTITDLQDLLALPIGDLLWLADPHHLGRRESRDALGHHRYRWVAKPSGGHRLLEEPKPLLNHVQRVVLCEILDNVPLHPAAHGFRRHRSVATYAAAHVGRAVLVHLDLEDFFGSVTVGRAFGIYRRCGYPEPVAHLLAGLKTSVRRAGERQLLAGVIVNERPNIDRRDHDRLKATLTNSARFGPDSQNHAAHPDFRAHLLGRVTWVEHLNPRRGARLRAVFDRIEWPPPSDRSLS